MRCRRPATKADAAVLMPREGTARAKERGVRFGRPMKLNAHQRQEALARIAAGEMQSDVARSYAISPATICRLQQSTGGMT